MLWKLNKVLYGLRSGPKKWGDHRDEKLKTMKVDTARCEPCENCANIWKVIDENDKVVAYFLVYVDDVMMVGPREWVRAITAAIKNLWECKDSGILSDPAKKLPIERDVVDSLHFLGVILEYQKGCLVIHQTKYIIAKLQKRGLLKGTCKASLPQVEEGKLVPEDKEAPEYAVQLEKSQIEVGALQWLAQKTRPDIAATTSIVASLQTRNPTEAIRLSMGIWKYLAATWDMAMRVEQMSGNPVSELALEPQKEYYLDAYTDASFAPGGDRSRTGVVLALNGYIIHWTSNKQSIVAVSSCEAELNASVTGLKLAIGMHALVAELTPKAGRPQLRMFGDNQAALLTITTKVTSWRTRHYAMRAAWIRDMVVEEECEVRHVRGTDLVSDALTKVLDRIKLSEARDRLRLVPGGEKKSKRE